MPHLVVAALVLAAADVSPDPSSLAVSAVDRQKAHALVGRLGSPVFEVRDEAAKQLRAMGRLALPVLVRAVATARDAEVRVRCEDLIPAAAAADFDARLAVFLADADGKYKHDLHGWARFRELTGEDPLARELFVELLKSEPNRALIAGLAQDKAELERRVIARRHELYMRMYQRGLPAWARTEERYEPTLIDAAGLLFAETLIGDKITPRGALRMVTPYTLLTRTGVRSELTADRLGPVTEKLVVAWMDSRTTATSLVQVLSVAGQVRPESVGKYAARLIGATGATAVHRASAAAMVARAGNRADLPALVPLLADAAVVRAGADGEEIQVRDVALAMAALLSGRDPADFGMDSRQRGGASYSYQNYSFPDEPTREKALARWAELEPKLAPTAKPAAKAEPRPPGGS
jgi:hypothetical protein